MIKSDYIKDIYYSIENDADYTSIKLQTSKHNLKDRDKEIVAYIKRYLTNKGLKDISVTLDNSLHTSDSCLSVRYIKICIWAKYNPFIVSKQYLDIVNNIINKCFLILEEV